MLTRKEKRFYASSKKTLRNNFKTMNNVLTFNIISEFEDNIDREANGCYAIPFKEDAPKYKIKLLNEYSKCMGKKTSELTDKELEKFLIKN